MDDTTAAHFAQAWAAANTRRPTRITEARQIVFADDGKLVTEEDFRAQQDYIDAREAEVQAEVISYLQDELSPALPREAAEALFAHAYAEVYNTSEYHLDGPEDEVFWRGLYHAYAGLVGLIAQVDSARGF